MDLSRDPHRGLVDELDDVHHKAVPQKFTKQDSFLNRRRHETASAEALINDEHSPDRFARLLNESATVDSGDKNSLPPDPTIITNNNFYERSLAPSWLLILFVAPLIVVLLVWLLVLLRRRFEQIQHIHLVNQNNVNGCVCTNQQSSSGQVFQYPHALTTHHDGSHREVFAQKHHLDKQHNKRGDKSTKLTTKLASRSSKPTSHHKTHNAGYLLESSSSGTSTSSSSTTPTSDSGSPAASPSVYNTRQPTTTNNFTVSNATPSGLRLDEKNSSCLLSLDPMHSLLKHMQLYLLTLTYQEIIACLVAFTIAIMNIVRMRNLFCCNLIIFILITSKFINLLTLTTFSITKLIKLCNLKVCDNRIYNMNYNTRSKNRNQSSKHSAENSFSQHHPHHDDRETIIFHSVDKKSEDSLIDRNTSSSQSSSSSTATRPAIATTTTTTVAPKHHTKSIDEPQIERPRSSGDKNDNLKSEQQSQKNHPTCGQSQRRRSLSPYDTSATICRLIVKDNKSKRIVDENSTESGEELFCFSNQDISCTEQHIAEVRDSSYILGSSKGKLLKSNNTIREPIVCHLMLITIISSTLGLVCLYLRLMPLSGPLLLNSSDNMNKSSLNGQDWSISIYAPSTTTEASTRYSSSTIDESRASLVNSNSNQNAQQQQPNYQATWSARFQQSSQLKHLIDQYELQNFITLLTDTHLQTSRFMCTLAADQYAPFARLSMMTLYAISMLLILILSIVIRHVGRKRLRQFELACLGRGLGKMSASNVLLGYYPNCLNCNRNNHSYLTSDNYLSTYTSGVAEFPMFLYGNASQQKATDSNRKRYSDLLKQNMAKQQQSSFDAYSLAALRMPHQSHQSRKNKLRNSSSLSSLLVTPTMIADGQLDESAKTRPSTTAFSASVDRYPPVQLVNSSKPYKLQQHRHHHHHQQQQQQLATSRQTHLRRLITAQSMCNLAPNSSQAHQVVTNTKIPAGKLASSGGQLAWLPLGSAATVASLSNIGRDPPTSTMEESEEDSWSKQLIATRLKLTDNSSKSDRQRVGNRRTTGNRERLGSIGEHLVDSTSTLNEHEKRDAVIESDLCGKNLDRLHGKNGMRGRITKKTSPNIETTTAYIDNNTKKLNELSTSPLALVSSHYQQQQLKQRTGSWPLYSNQHENYQQSQYQCQQIDYHDGVKNRLNYEELKRDLRLSQSVILFGQLLNHAPILLLLAIAKFAPDGLIAGWNSSHDNGFIWLTLIEAFVFPLFLCTLDPSLTFALKRSLRCTTKSGPVSKPTVSSSTSGTSKANRLTTTTTADKSHQQLAHDKLNFNASSAVNQAGTGLAHQTQISIKNRQCNNNADLILGSSVSYPDFMFACQRNINNRVEGYAEVKLPAPSSSSSSPSSTAPQIAKATNINSNITTGGQEGTNHQSFTGPSPPRLITSSSKQRELNIDIADDSLRANFALMTKDPLRNLALRSNFKSGLVDPALNCSLVGTGDLLASRRARYNEFLSGRSRRKLRTSALLSATKKLLRFSSKSRDRNDKQQRTYQKQKQRSNSTSLAQVSATTSSSLSFGYSISNSSTADTKGGKPNKEHHQSGDAAGRMSPTSSLSTLIRKFNHDNYTNVCQQYEQRKQEIAVEENRDNSLERRHTKRNDSPTQVVVVVDNNNQSVYDKQEVLIDGLDGTSGSGKVRVFSNHQQKQHQQKLDKDEQRNLLLVEEEGIFCRKGGLYYNYCLDDQTTPVKSEPTTNIQQNLTNQATSRVNPMLQVKAFKEQTNNTANEFNASSNPGSSFASSNKAKSERCLILEESFNERTRLDYSNVERLVNGTKEKQAPLDKNINSKIAVKDSSAIKVEGKKRKTSTTNTTATTNTTTTNIISSKQSNGTKQNVNDSNNNETIISNITSVQELLNKMNGIMEKQQEFQNSSKSIKGVPPETGGRSSSSNSSGFESSSKQLSNDVSKNGRNNKTVLEMVTRNNNNNLSFSNNNKESNKQSDTCANQVRQLTAAIASSIQPKQQAGVTFFDNSSSNFNYNTLDGGTTLDYASLRSVDDALSLVSVSSEFEYHNINHGLTQPVHHHHQVNSLEQPTPAVSILVRGQNSSTTASSSTTIAVETSGSESVSSSNSTVSLKLSPESDFRTSSATCGGSKVGKLEQNTTTSAGHHMVPSLASSSLNHSVSNNIGSTYSNSSSGSNSSGRRRLEDLRFPSFLPTKSQLAEAVAAASASDNSPPFKLQHQIKPPKSRVVVSLNKQSESQKSTSNISTPQVLISNPNNKANSSSLLNLTTAKFAVLNNHNSNSNSNNNSHSNSNSISNPPKQQQQHEQGRNSQLGCKLPAKVAGSSNTITKQKKSATNDHIVTLTEFNSRQSSNGCESNSNNQTECSLPSESGNVRARIRKMEQQQSSAPNLANSSQKKQQAAPPVGSANNRNNQRNVALIGSMIPVTSSSRLPVLTSSNLQLSAAAAGSRNNGSSSNRNQKVNQAQRLSYSASGSNNLEYRH